MKPPSSAAPIIRRSWIAPTHAESLACDDQFLLGDALLAPSLMKAPHRGKCFYHRENGLLGKAASHTGDQHLTIPVTLDTLPLYVRAGRFCGSLQLPNRPIMTDQPLTLDVYLFPRQPSGNG